MISKVYLFLKKILNSIWNINIKLMKGNKFWNKRILTDMKTSFIYFFVYKEALFKKKIESLPFVFQ